MNISNRIIMQRILSIITSALNRVATYHLFYLSFVRFVAGATYVISVTIIIVCKLQVKIYIIILYTKTYI